MPRSAVATVLIAFLALAGALALPNRAAAASAPVVAVIDTGADLRHPALRKLAWRNPAEVPGNGLDDDGNGYIDDVHGYDFIDRGARPGDPRGHGTHIAGLIARRGFKRRRPGRPSGARLMVLRVLGPDGTGPTTALVEAIDYAVANGARILNLSVAYYDAHPTLEAALGRATAAGVLIVTAAGNRREDLDRTDVYPASFRTPTMLVVAASGGRRLESWSARGAGTVDLAAPGAWVRSSLPSRRYGRRSGTSQATAIVTRAAVRLLGRAPGADAGALRAALVAGVRRLPRLRSVVASGGRVHVRGAVQALLRTG